MPAMADFLLVFGLVALALAVPRSVAAYAQARAPWDGAAIALAGLFAVAIAWLRADPAYALGDVPQVFYRVLAVWWNS